MDRLGGRLWDVSQSFVGLLADAALERMSLDRVLLSANAITAQGDIWEAAHSQTRSMS